MPRQISGHVVLCSLIPRSTALTVPDGCCSVNSTFMRMRPGKSSSPTVGARMSSIFPVKTSYCRSASILPARRALYNLRGYMPIRRSESMASFHPAQRRYWRSWSVALSPRTQPNKRLLPLPLPGKTSRHFRLPLWITRLLRSMAVFIPSADMMAQSV